jgi:hypothetical protein
MKDNYADHLRGILSGSHGGAYIGGTLDLGDGWLNTDGFAYSGESKRPLSEEEHYLVCKIYLKHKTPNHAFYNFCDKFVSDYLAKRIVGNI